MIHMEKVFIANFVDLHILILDVLLLVYMMLNHK